MSSTPVPSVSIVVPLYNKERHVARAIESVLDQSIQDFEIVVVDDGSTDGSAAVVRSISDPRIRLLAQSNAGVSAARNRGIAEARSALIAFLDADDAYRPDFFARVFELRRDRPTAVAFALNYETVDADGTRALGVGAASVTSDTTMLDPLTFFSIGKYGSPVFSSSVAVLKRSLEQVGMFPLGVKLGEDLDTWLRICFVSPIAFDRRPGSIYFTDAEQRACVINPPPEHYVFFDTIDRWVVQHPGPSATLLDEIREFKNSFVIVYARFQIRFGIAAEGRRALWHCRTRVFALQKWKWLVASFLPQRWQNTVVGLRRGLRAQS